MTYENYLFFGVNFLITLAVFILGYESGRKAGFLKGITTRIVVQYKDGSKEEY